MPWEVASFCLLLGGIYSPVRSRKLPCRKIIKRMNALRPGPILLSSVDSEALREPASPRMPHHIPRFPGTKPTLNKLAVQCRQQMAKENFDEEILADLRAGRRRAQWPVRRGA